ncbi:MAG: phosphatidate cytidylyltransferase [Thermodesulfovibrionales bacterium]|nr:phosphatidate cytidylyltransferase [Thermodesulfovibrionales bacterium]
MHLKRIAVAAVLLPALYLYIMYLPAIYFLFFLIFMSVIAMSEFYSMYRLEGMLRYAGLFSGVSILSISYISKDLLLDIIIFSVIAIAGIRLLFKRNPMSSLSEISLPVFGLLYIPCLLTFQAQIREIGPEWIILLYATVWAADSVAYYLGTLMGKRKLYVEVSPNKTVAGAAGSLVGGIIAAMIMKATLIPVLSVPSALLIGIIIGIISVLGDLVESMFKRDAGVKDSGTIIPGHGGILDKIDGVLFAGPILFWILTVLGIIK